MARKLSYWSVLCCIFILIISCLVITGWLLNLPVLTKLLPGLIAMRFNTALSFILLSIALIFINTLKERKYSPVIKVIGVAIGGLAAATLAQDVFVFDLGLDTFFYSQQMDKTYEDSALGRMSPATSIFFMISGFSVTTYDRKNLTFTNIMLFNTMMLITFVILTGYIFGIDEFYRLNFKIPMAVNTAFCFFLFAIAYSILNPSIGIFKYFAGSRLGSKVSRAIFARSAIIIFIVGYLRMLLDRHGYFSEHFNSAGLTLVIIFVLLYISVKTSVLLTEIEHTKDNAEERLRIFFEQAPICLLNCDENGIIMANRLSESIFGVSAEQLRGCKVDNLLVPAPLLGGNTHQIKSVSELSKLSGDTSYYANALREDGVQVPVEIKIIPITTPMGSSVFYSLNNISDRIKSESIINKQMLELEAKNLDTERFIYIASHDLQEPIRTIINYIDLLREDYPDIINREIDEHLSNMHSAMTRMSALVKSLLDYGRLGQNKVLSLSDCNKLLSEVKSDLASLINSTGTVIIADALPIISCYETELRQVFQNLLNNAIKFRKPGIKPNIVITYSEQPDAHRFCVKDNGIGIDSKYSQRIFQMFQRLHNYNEYDGYGVGLANCQKIIQFHGGTIWVDSELGLGSSFIFDIPKIVI